MTARKKRPRDTNQLAKFIVDVASGEVEDHHAGPPKNEAAAALGRLGGLKGGKARARNMSESQRKAAAKKAARARWAKKSK